MELQEAKNKLYHLHFDERLDMIYMWVKSKYINRKEFKKLIDYSIQLEKEIQ